MKLDRINAVRFREFCVIVPLLLLGQLLIPSALSDAANETRAAGGAPYASLAADKAALIHALTVHSLPSSLNPTLADVASAPFPYEGASYQHQNCNPYASPSEAAHPNPCWYGSPNLTKPVVVIFGDSFVGNWIPALDVVGQKLGFRIASFEFSGCDTPNVAATVGSAFTPAQVAACNLWHTTLPKEVVALHPQAIVAANGATDWGVPGDRTWMTGMKFEFTRMNPHGTATQILLGTGPHLDTWAPSCLAANSASVQNCTFHYASSSNFQSALNRDVSAVKLLHVHLVPTYQWICVSGACPVIVGSTLAFVDADHFSTVYSLQMSVLLQAALKPLIH